jgi:hypothetical protein
LKAIFAVTLLAIAGLSAPALAQAQDKASSPDRALLATFCDPGNIKGLVCTRARGYRSGRRCDVALQGDRHSGRFLADGTALLVVDYESGCEPRATGLGGAVLFEQKDGAVIFRGYQPGFRPRDCITVPRNEKQDRLICITGHLGQGHLESGVVEMVFTRDFSRTIGIAMNFFVTGNDTVLAYGANVVPCKDTSKHFGFSKLGPGPARDTVAVDIAHADKETIEAACSKRLPPPKETYRDPGDGEAYVAEGLEKNARFVIDLTTSRAVPEAEFGKQSVR